MQKSLNGPWRLYDDNPNEWEWGHKGYKPRDLASWLTVDVPTSVQAALWQAGLIPPPYVDLNSRAAEWVEHRDWIFGLNFAYPPPLPGQRVFLEFESVNDACLIYLNQQLVGQHEGAAAPFSFEIGPLLRVEGNQLLILLTAAQPEDPQIGRTERTRSLKGRMGYGWDFAPRLVRTGLMDEVRLRQTGPHRLTHLWVKTGLSPDYHRATVTLEAEIDGPAGAEVRFTLAQAGQLVASATVPALDGLARARFELDHPALWWPNGSGDQPLYLARAEVSDGSDSLEREFGVREVRWETRAGAEAGEWPFVLVVNGQRLFQKGWNWVPADAMGGPAADERLPNLLKLAQEAGANFLRVWGGADPESRAFYAECDRRGLLVWQEFPLSSAGLSNLPPSDPAYLARLENYARAVVKARRHHPSLALWGGGNELLGEDGKPLTLAHPYARTLQAVVQALDPDRQFRPSSPLGPTFDADPEAAGPLWDVHGAWDYSQRYPGPQYWRLNAIRPLLHSEVGLAGEASLETQHEFLSPPYRSRQPSNPARRHHNGAWWEFNDILLKVFGEFADDAQAVTASQWLQADGLRYYIEETRRRWPDVSAGIYPWQFNEPWPTVICTSAVEYTGRPKLAYGAVRRAYAPALITTRYQELRFPMGQPLHLDLWAINDGPQLEANLEIEAHDLEGRQLATLSRPDQQIAGGRSTALGELDIILPGDFQGIVILSLKLGQLENRYLFSNLAAPALRPLLAHPALMQEFWR